MHAKRSGIATRNLFAELNARIWKPGGTGTCATQHAGLVLLDKLPEDGLVITRHGEPKMLAQVAEIDRIFDAFGSELDLS